MKKKCISLKLAKKLYENGCRLESEETWSNNMCGWIPVETIPAYDILNEICVKHTKEFFGDKMWKSTYSAGGYCDEAGLTAEILSFLQQNKKKEAEDYIWEHCLFNPKNKETK